MIFLKKNGLSLGILIVFGVIIGGIVGIIDYIFGTVLLLITDFRMEHMWWLIPFLAPAGLLIIFLYKKFGKKASGGMKLIFDVGNGHDEGIPKRLTPLIIITTWLTHLFGGSAGREGVAVQIGAGVANCFESKLTFLNIKDQRKIFLVTGMAAGFAGLFQTPFAALFFAIEVLVVGSMQYKALIPALIAALTASGITSNLGLEKFSFPLQVDITFDVITIIKFIFLGIIFGVVGNGFTQILVWTKKKLSHWLPNPFWRIGISGIILSVLLLIFNGRYAGLGTNLIYGSFYGDNILSYDWLLKLGLTILTLAAGFQGGEVTPLFAIGSTLGVLLAILFGFPIELVAALGYASVFASATNTLLAPIFIGAEVFGFENIPYFIIVCMIAYSCNKNQSIYSGQKILDRN